VADPLRIRPVAPGDGEGLARVWTDICSYYLELDRDLFQIPETEGLAESFEHDITSGLPETEISLVAELEGNVVGWVWAQILPPADDAKFQLLRELGTHRLVIEALAVLREHWRGGIGERLVGEVEEWARQRGATISNLDTYIHSPVSVPFYEQGVGYSRRSLRLQKRLR
jgi:GNAT superfamily N-acetyltransferase